MSSYIVGEMRRHETEAEDGAGVKNQDILLRIDEALSRESERERKGRSGDVGR